MSDGVLTACPENVDQSRFLSINFFCKTNKQVIPKKATHEPVTLQSWLDHTFIFSSHNIKSYPFCNDHSLCVLTKLESATIYIFTFSWRIPLMTQLPHLTESDRVYGDEHWSENRVLAVVANEPSPSIEAMKDLEATHLLLHPPICY